MSSGKHTVSHLTDTLLRALAAPDGVIAFATDTVYGLGARPDRPAALERLFAMKGRDANKPLILLGACAERFKPYLQAPVPPLARRLMQAHWPGPLTLVLAKSPYVSEAITRGETTVGCRVTACNAFNALLALLPEGVLATTSANRSGEPPCLSAQAVTQTFGMALPVLADDAAIATSQASTVARVQADGTLTVLRPGPILLP